MTMNDTVLRRPKYAEDVNIEAGYYIHSRKLGEGNVCFSISLKMLVTMMSHNLLS